MFPAQNREGGSSVVSSWEVRLTVGFGGLSGEERRGWLWPRGARTGAGLEGGELLHGGLQDTAPRDSGPAGTSGGSVFCTLSPGIFRHTPRSHSHFRQRAVPFWTRRLLRDNHDLKNEELIGSRGSRDVCLAGKLWPAACWRDGGCRSPFPPLRAKRSAGGWGCGPCSARRLWLAPPSPGRLLPSL